MRRILVTGMSGTGKSTVLAALGGHGFRVVDTDEPGWKDWRDGEEVWHEDRIAALLESEAPQPLVVSGCVVNQGSFYDRFDAVVLLSAPAEVILGRIRTRTTNSFGRAPAERERILADLAAVEPRLRATATHEIDASQPLDVIVARLLEIGRGSAR
jgi:dephospho-CoA kinase